MKTSPISFGRWHYDEAGMALVFDRSGPDSGLNRIYAVKLETLTNSGELLDWILQIAKHNYSLPDFIKLVNEMCQEYLSTNVQAAFSPFGQHRRIDWDRLVSEKTS